MTEIASVSWMTIVEIYLAIGYTRSFSETYDALLLTTVVAEKFNLLILRFKVAQLCIARPFFHKIYVKHCFIVYYSAKF